MTSQHRHSAADKLFHSRWTELGEDKLYSFERTYIALFWLFGDVFNGGFDNYFYNASGDLALQAVDGLGRIGAENTKLIVADAISAFGENGYSADLDTRRERLSALSDPQFDVLEKKFFEFSDADSDLALGWLAEEYGRVGLNDT